MWIPGKGRQSQTPYLQSNALLQRIIFTAFFCGAELPCAASFCWMRIWRAQSYLFAVYSVTLGRHYCWRCQNRAGVGLSPAHPLSSESPEFRGCQRHLFFFFKQICFMDICGPFRHKHYDPCIFQLHTLWLFLQSAVELPASSKASAYKILKIKF